MATSKPQLKDTTPELQYVQISANQAGALLVRSDGIVDRTFGKGVIHRQIHPPSGTSYIAASAGHGRDLLLRDDGVVVKLGRSGPVVGSELRPPPGRRYVGMAAGACGDSYLLLDSGVVEMAGFWSGNVYRSRSPPPGVKYIAASTGVSCAYLLRSDGKIDRLQCGKIQKTMGGDAAGSNQDNSTKTADTSNTTAVFYTAVSEQLTISTHNSTHSSYANYLVTANGSVHRTVSRGKIQKVMVPSIVGVGYTAAAAGNYCSYLLRSDGLVDRTVHFGTVQKTMSPPKGAAYIQVTAGDSASYLLLDTGVVHRTVSGGRVSQMMVPETPAAFAARRARSSLQATVARIGKALFGWMAQLGDTAPGGVKATSGPKPIAAKFEESGTAPPRYDALVVSPPPYTVPEKSA